jgi:hypothetical protein
MKIEITKDPQKEEYHWKLWDGPDGIDERSGTESSLGNCFEAIVENRIIIALSYLDSEKT